MCEIIPAKMLIMYICPQKESSFTNCVPNNRRRTRKMNAITIKLPIVAVLSLGVDSIIIVKGIHPSEIGNDNNSMYHQEKNEIKAQIKPNAKQVSNARM